MTRREGSAVFRAVVSLALAVAALATPIRAHAAGPTVTLRAPTNVRVGEPLELVLRLRGAEDVAGFETELLFDRAAAEFASVDYGTSRLESLPGAFGQLDPVELRDGVAFGSYTCPTRRCTPQEFRLPARGASGRVTLARVRLLPLKAGRLELRLTRTRLVGPDGSYVEATGGERVLTVNVGRGGRVRQAPIAPPLRPAAASRKPVRDLTGDGRLTEQDVTEAAVDWAVARDDGRVCGGSPADANRDGCLDVADLQRVAVSVASEPARAIAVTATNQPLMVNSTGDGVDAAPGNGVCRTSAGVCSLRAAIQEANAQAGANAIDFAIPASGVQTIQLGSVLPTLSDTSGPTMIDGYTQPGASPNTDQNASNAQIKVAVRGTGSFGIDGLKISSANNVVAGLSFFNLRRSIWIVGSNAKGNVIRGDFVGTNPSGTFGFGAADFNLYAIGIEFSSGANNNRIGETTLAGRNVISGNARHGMSCYTGTSNVVYNNIIGLSPLGDRRLMNVYHGADWNGECAYNIVGGTGTLQRNIVSGNGVPNDHAGEAGIEISHGPNNTGNQIIGNCFGTDVTCTSSPSWTFNSFWGIHVEDTATNSVIRDNVIVSSRNGAIKIQGGGTSGTQVTANCIGVGRDGRALPNSAFGILLAGGTNNNRIGPGNLIANNPVGVSLVDPYTDYNTITRNSIWANGGLGIDLAPTGVNPNDVGDTDTGPNQQLNYPVITHATTTSVTGTACGGCLVEVFLSDSDPSGYGEGKTFVGSTTAGTSGSFAVSVSGLTAGAKVTATATNSGGNTSEFARNTTVQAS